MRTAKSYSDRQLKPARSEDIQGQIQAFLAKGGQIKQIAQGVSGEELMALRRSSAMANAARASASSRRASFGIKRAAQMISVSHGWLAKQCDLGIGPPFYMSGKSKQFLRDEVLEWWKNRESE